MRRVVPPRRAALVAMAALLAAGCTDDGASTPTLAPATTTTTTTPERIDDGVLRVGILLPESGAGATIGQPLIDAVLAAAEEIDAAGGVLGRRIDLVTGFDEGDSVSAARDAIASLIERDVDAVIGPASSTIALATLTDLLRAGILTCSPTATALALDDFPDRELFIRTAPSDSLQAVAIADEAERTGALTAAVVYLDDPYGRPLADATIAALRAKNITVEQPVGFAADDDSLVDEATTVADSGAGVVIVLADGEQGTRVLASLGEVTGVVPGQEQPRIIVNDALRRPPSPQQIASLAADVRDRITGVSPAASSGTVEGPRGPYATNAYDCMNLIALASAQARSDDPAAIASKISEVSNGGVSCRRYAECLELVAGTRNVDYDGPSGNLQIGPDGDPLRYRFDRWSYDAQGLDVALTSGSFAVSS